MDSETKFHVSVMDARLKKVKKQCDQYKKAYQHCVDDLIVLRANNKRLERGNTEQLALLKQFRKLIDYKLTLHQDRYPEPNDVRSDL